MKNLLTAFLLLSLLSCGASFQKKSFLQEYAQFVEDVSTNGGGFDEKKWTEIEAKFTTLTEVDYPKIKEAFSAEEVKTYNELTGRYYGALTRHQASKIKKELEGLLDQTQGVLDELRK